MTPNFQSYILTVGERLYTRSVYSDFTLRVLLSKILNLRFYGIERTGGSSSSAGVPLNSPGRDVDTKPPLKGAAR